MLENALFYILALGALISGIGVVRSRSAIYAVLWLVLAMCFTAGLYILLKAFLVAVIQVMVYAGAILVLFLFIVMLMDTQQMNSVKGAGWVTKAIAIVAGVAFFTLLVTVIRSVRVPQMPVIHGVPETIGRILFNQFVLPFELTSLLILAAVTSIVVLAKKDSQ
jgi:NADH-quinone oxidoreductase subunit J